MLKINSYIINYNFQFLNLIYPKSWLKNLLKNIIMFLILNIYNKMKIYAVVKGDNDTPNNRE